MSFFFICKTCDPACLRLIPLEGLLAVSPLLIRFLIAEWEAACSLVSACLSADMPTAAGKQETPEANGAQDGVSRAAQKESGGVGGRVACIAEKGHCRMESHRDRQSWDGIRSLWICGIRSSTGGLAGCVS